MFVVSPVLLYSERPRHTLTMTSQKHPSLELGFAAIRAGKCDQLRSRLELGFAAIRAGKCDQLRSPKLSRWEYWHSYPNSSKGRIGADDDVSGHHAHSREPEGNPSKGAKSCRFGSHAHA